MQPVDTARHRLAPRKARGTLAATLTGAALVAGALVATPSADAATAPLLQMAQTSDRAGAFPLRDAVVTGGLYAWTTSASNVKSNKLWIDAATTATPLVSVSGTWAALGGITSGVAKAYDTTKLAEGRHELTARTVFSDGSVATQTVPFWVRRSPALMVSSYADRHAPTALSGSTVTGVVYITASSGGSLSKVSFWRDVAVATGTAAHSESSAPFDYSGGSKTAAQALDTRNLSDGTHSILARVTTSAGTTSVLATYTVANNVASPSPTATAVPSSSPSPRPTATVTPTVTATPTPTPTPTVTPTVMPTVAPTPIPSPSPSTSGPGGTIRRGPTNTGVPAGTALKPSGSITVSVAGTVIDGLDVSGSITVTADNVTIRRTRVRQPSGVASYPIRLQGGTNMLVEDVTVIGSGVSSVGICCKSFTLRRVDISNSFDGVRADGDVLIEQSYIHELARGTATHNDAIQTLKGSNITIRDNTLLPYRADDNDPMNSAYIISASEVAGAPVDNVVITGNYVNGGNFTLMPGGSSFWPVTHVKISGNRWGRNFRYGPVSQISDAAGWDNATNVYDDNGAPVR